MAVGRIRLIGVAGQLELAGQVLEVVAPYVWSARKVMLCPVALSCKIALIGWWATGV